MPGRGTIKAISTSTGPRGTVRAGVGVVVVIVVAVVVAMMVVLNILEMRYDSSERSIRSRR